VADRPDRTVDEAMVEQLARLAQLDLAPERRARVADQLDGLLSEANRVNRFMDGRREVGPAVRFEHPELDLEDE
jgi:Asp-tRNA(Asn)/Glu-tRNA(Gln) amidotransferase C subunit